MSFGWPANVERKPAPLECPNRNFVNGHEASYKLLNLLTRTYKDGVLGLPRAIKFLVTSSWPGRKLMKWPSNRLSSPGGSVNSGSKGIVSLLPALGVGAKDTIPNERSTKEVDKMMWFGQVQWDIYGKFALKQQISSYEATRGTLQDWSCFKVSHCRQRVFSAKVKKTVGEFHPVLGCKNVVMIDG